MHKNQPMASTSDQDQEEVEADEDAWDEEGEQDVNNEAGDLPAESSSTQEPATVEDVEAKGSHPSMLTDIVKAATLAEVAAAAEPVVKKQVDKEEKEKEAKESKADEQTKINPPKPDAAKPIQTAKESQQPPAPKVSQEAQHKEPAATEAPKQESSSNTGLSSLVGKNCFPFHKLYHFWSAVHSRNSLKHQWQFLI